MGYYTTHSEDYFQTIIYSNSPWIKDPVKRRKPELFKREVFYRVKKQVEAPHGMAVLIKGPRRVGKTEIQKQLIWHLIEEKKVAPEKVFYLSFDDVQIQAEKPANRAKFVQDILNTWAQILGSETYDEIDTEAYCFFDEVQAVEEWAHLVKNRIERNSKIRIVLSGSAAHSIFDKALKVLLGRVVSEKLPAFSFREYLAKNHYISEHLLADLQDVQLGFEKNLSINKLSRDLQSVLANVSPIIFRTHISAYLKDGGFPQLWNIPVDNIIEKAHFIDENYVKKVTLEDLMLLQQIKKPELYERLLRHLFARPGQEYNQNKVASELGTTEITLSDGIRLLEQTDLLVFVEKFSHKAEPLRRKNLKIYPVDLMLNFATTKMIPNLADENAKGIIAESLVAQTLFRLRGLSNIAYIRSDAHNHSGEIDFYIRSDTHDCPIEVKYQNKVCIDDVHFLRAFIKERDLSGGLLITPESWEIHDGVHNIPLWAFMLLS